MKLRNPLKNGEQTELGFEKYELRLIRIFIDNITIKTY